MFSVGVIEKVCLGIKIIDKKLLSEVPIPITSDFQAFEI